MITLIYPITCYTVRYYRYYLYYGALRRRSGAVCGDGAVEERSGGGAVLWSCGGVGVVGIVAAAGIGGSDVGAVPITAITPLQHYRGVMECNGCNAM